MKRWLCAVASAAVMVGGLLSNFPAYAQTIGSGMTGNPDYICGEKFDAPKGTISFRTLIENLQTYFNHELSGRWGRLEEKTNEFIPAPSVAFLLEYGFSINLGSLDGGMQGKVLMKIRAVECYDLVVHMPDGSKRSLAFIGANLRWAGASHFANPEDIGQSVYILFSDFLRSIADGKKILVIARLSGHTWDAWVMGGDYRYRRLILEFEIENYHVFK